MEDEGVSIGRGGGPLATPPGGTYPAAALALSLIASSSSFVEVDSGIGTDGMLIEETGKGDGYLPVITMFELEFIVSGVASIGCGFLIGIFS